jgi:hypothetical protein
VADDGARHESIGGGRARVQSDFCFLHSVDYVDGLGAQNEMRGLEVNHLVAAVFRDESVSRARPVAITSARTMSKPNEEIADGFPWNR